jgi:YD repeat-containing protein
VTWKSPWGEAIWYGFPIQFTAVTNPPGYEGYVTWTVDTMHDMETRADPPTGMGPRFTTTFTPTTDTRFFWAQVYSSNLAVLAQTDLKPPAFGPLGGNDGLEPPGRGCQALNGGDLTRRPTTRNSGDVYLHSGEYFLEQVDLRIKGRGFDFVWKRKYRSREGRNTVMGWNWDFSYNIRVEASTLNPPDRWIYSGDSRRDTYRPTGTGCWIAEGLFNELCQDVGGSYVLTFPDMTKWRLKALDGSLTAGLIQSITDRNQNTMSFAYDAAGRLMTITDTVGHTIQVTYTPDGHIAAVTGPLGRQVTYAYYAAGATGGSTGDLMSWTSAPVTGTPTGNDFPAGKTITYTYSVGLPQPALLHNLTSITDALGRQFLLNV